MNFVLVAFTANFEQILCSAIFCCYYIIRNMFSVILRNILLFIVIIIKIINTFNYHYYLLILISLLLLLIVINDIMAMWLKYIYFWGYFPFEPDLINLFAP